MPDRVPFDSCDPFDAIADHARVRMAELGFDIVQDRRYRALQHDPQAQFQALMMGLMTGLSGFAMAHASPESHADVRDVLVAMIPDAMNCARDILDLPPLEPIQ